MANEIGSISTSLLHVILDRKTGAILDIIRDVAVLSSH